MDGYSKKVISLCLAQKGPAHFATLLKFALQKYGEW